MKNLLAIAILLVLIVLAVFSFAPAEWVGLRSGYASPAGIVTALGLLALTLAGGWIWHRDRRNRHD